MFLVFSIFLSVSEVQEASLLSSFVVSPFSVRVCVLVPFFESCLAWARKAASKYIAASCSGCRRSFGLVNCGCFLDHFAVLADLADYSGLIQSFPFSIVSVSIATRFIDHTYLPWAARNPKTAWGVESLSHLYPTCNVCVAYQCAKCQMFASVQTPLCSLQRCSH